MKTETTRMLCNEIKERKEFHSMKTNENRDMRQSKRTICNENREREEYWCVQCKIRQWKERKRTEQWTERKRRMLTCNQNRVRQECYAMKSDICMVNKEREEFAMKT